MTPFMLRVAEVVGAPDGGHIPEVAPMPTTRISQRISTSTGADRHVAIRSLAEQLLCEANAVLGPTREHLDLVDETLPSELVFTVRYAGRAARVSTVFEDGLAYGRLVGDGFESELPRELEDADAVPDLLLRLVVSGSSDGVTPVAS